MKQVLTAAIFAAGLAASGAQAGAEELRVPLSLTSFGMAQAIASYQMSAAGLALGPAAVSSGNEFAGSPVVMPVAYGGAAVPQLPHANVRLRGWFRRVTRAKVSSRRDLTTIGGTLPAITPWPSIFGSAGGGSRQ